MPKYSGNPACNVNTVVFVVLLQVRKVNFLNR